MQLKIEKTQTPVESQVKYLENIFQESLFQGKKNLLKKRESEADSCLPYSTEVELDAELEQDISRSNEEPGHLWGGLLGTITIFMITVMGFSAAGIILTSFLNTALSDPYGEESQLVQVD